MINIGKLSASMASMLNYKLDFNGTNYKRYNIFITARNGNLTQLLRIKRINNNWYFATRVKRDNETIFEKIDDEIKNQKNELFD